MNKNTQKTSTDSSRKKNLNGKTFSRGQQSRNSGKKNRNRDAAAKQDFNKRDETQFSNDPAWYASDPTLARDSASIPFSWATGTTSSLGLQLPVGFEVPTAQANAYYNFAAPGIMTLALRSFFGGGDNPTAPINIAAASIYSYVRHANSGSKNYAPADLTMYLIGIGEIIALTNHLIRLYGAAGLASSRNRYIPRTIVRAMGGDYDDVITNMAQLRYGINLAMNKLSSFAVPANFTYYKRKSFLFSGLYTEGTSTKDQMYMYVPAGFWKLTTDADGATALSYTNVGGATLGTNGWTVQQWLTLLNSMIDPLLMDEDTNIMSGDILKAYGEAGILKYGRVEENFTIQPTFDIGVLEQFKNATIVRLGARAANTEGQTTGVIKITQGPQKAYIVANDDTVETPASYTVAEKIAEQYLQSNRILTTSTAEVGPDLVLESTRLMATSTVSNGSTANTLKIVYSAGTEIVTAARVYGAETLTAAEDDVVASPLFSVACLDVIGPTAPVDSLVGHFRTISRREAFKFAPSLTTLTVNLAGTTPSIIGVAQAIAFDNYAVLTPEDLKRMNEACFLNMTRVPAIGSIYQT